MAPPSSQQQEQQRQRAPTTLIDLPEDVLGERIVAHPELDAGAHLALFQSCHALARLVLQHGHGVKRLTLALTSSKQQWPTALAHLLGTAWQPLAVPGGLQLHMRGARSRSSGWRLLLPDPPPRISQHVTSLHLRTCALSTSILAAWQLHNAALWPHLRHLAVHGCFFPGVYSNSLITMKPLQPIPQLHSFSWTGTSVATPLSIRALATLAAKATLADFCAGHSMLLYKDAVQRMQLLTRAQLDCVVNVGWVALLLGHPTLQHVTLGGVVHADWLHDCDCTQQPCRWRTLTLLGVRDFPVHILAQLPLSALERLTLGGHLSWHVLDAGGHPLAVGAGVAVLRQLHSRGGLVLMPHHGEPQRRAFLAQPGDGLFGLSGTEQHTPAVVRLVLEAGQGINTLVFGQGSLSLQRLREEVAPLVRQHAGKVTTLCFHGWLGQEMLWGLIASLPSSIRHVKVDVSQDTAGFIRAVVEGGLLFLRHPLTLTLMLRAAISAELEAELRQLVLQQEEPRLLSLEMALVPVE